MAISLYISDSDTIGSFIEKLKGIGVDSSFNNSTGIFSINLSKDAITDTDNTGIVDALHIEGVNEGYTSNKLQIEKTETVYSVANANTLLNDITNIKILGTMSVKVKNSNGESYSFNVSETTTLGKFMSDLRVLGLSAELNKGVLEIGGGQITGGTYNAVRALGLKADTNTSQVKGNALTETIVEYEVVTYDTRLVDDLGVSEGYLEVVDSEGNNQYLKIYSGQTIGDLMSDLANMGIYSTLDEETGVLSITGGEFNTLTDADVNALIANGTIRETNDRYSHGTDLLTALYGAPAISANQTAVSQTYAMSQALSKSETQIVSATESTTLRELGVDTNESIILHKEDGSTETFNVTGATTLGDLLATVNNNGVTARLEDGVIYLEGGWIENTNLENALGLEHTTASSHVLGSEKTVTKTYDANYNTKLSELGLGDSVITIKGQDDVELGRITTNADMTIGEILTAMAGYGISGTIKNGVITLDSNNGAYAQGGVLDDFGVGTATTTFTTSVGVINTSSEIVSQTYSVTANSDTTLSDLGLGLSTISVKGTDGAVLGTITTHADMTLGDVLTALAGYGISGTMKDGVITLKSDDGKYIEGGIATSLGIGTTTTTFTTTTGTTNTSSGAVSAITSIVADSKTTLGDLGLGVSTISIKGTDGVEVGTITTNADMTIGDLLTALAGYEISGAIKDGVITLKSDDKKYAEGGVLDSMGIGTTETTYTKTIGINLISSAPVTYTSVKYTTTFPTITQTITTTGTIVTTEPVIGTKTISVTDTIVTTEPVMGTETIKITHTIVTTEPVIGSETITVTNTIVTTEPVIGTETIVFTHTIVTTEPVIGTKTLTVTSTATATVVETITTGGLETIVTTATVVTTTTVETTITVNGSTTVTVEKIADEDTLLRDIVDSKWYDEEEGGYILEDENYHSPYTFSADSTLGDVLNAIRSFGYTATISNGVISVHGEFESNLAGPLAHGLGFTKKYQAYNHVIGNEEVGSYEGTATFYVEFTTLNEDFCEVPSSFTWYTSANKYISASDSLKDLGLDYCNEKIYYYFNYGGSWELTSLAITEETTILELQDSFKDYLGISLSISGKNLVGTTDGRACITGMDSNLSSFFNADLSEWLYGNREVEDTVYGSDKISEFSGVSDSGSIVFTLGSGGTFTVNWDSTTTVDQLVVQISSNGISASYNDGYMHIGSRIDSEYVTGCNSIWFQDVFGINFSLTWDYEEYYVYDDTSSYLKYNTTSVTDTATTVVSTTTETQTEVVTSTKVIDTTETVTVTQTVTTTVVETLTIDDAKTVVVTHRIETTLEVEKTTTQPVTHTIVTTLTVENTGTQPVTHVQETTLVVDKTGSKLVTHTVSATFTVEETGTQTVTHTVYGTGTIETTTCQIDSTTVTMTLTRDTTFEELGLHGQLSLGIVGIVGGLPATLPLNHNNTVEDLMDYLEMSGFTCSISLGRLTIKGADGYYIYGIGQDLADALKLPSTGPYYTTSTQTTKVNTSSDAQGYNTTNTMTTDDTFAQLGLGADGTITLTSDGVLRTVTVKTTDTVDDLITQLASHGITAFVRDGKLTLQGDNEAFVNSVSSGLKTFLKLGDTNYTTATHTSKANTTSDEQNYNTTNTLSTDDTLGIHGLTADGTITVVSDGTQYVVTVHADDTIDDMLTSLAGLGIYGYVNGGKLSLKGDDEAFIKGISANLNTVLKLGETNFVTDDHTITKNTNSNHLTHNVTTLMSDSTLLTDLGITNGEFKITEKGIDYIFNLNTATIRTIGDFRNLLADYGFTSYVDDKGRLVIMGNGDSSLSSVAGGSNILTQLDIDDWTFGNMSQKSSYLIDTTIVGDGRINGDTKMTELRDSSGNLLGITTGEYVVVSNGVRTVETITADTTVDDFIYTLGSYGMVANLATDGSISIGAQHNSYLATSASAGVNTNAIDVLFAEWDFVNVYTSNNIEMPEDVVVSITRDTKLADINEGTYVDGCITVVHDGIKTNLSLTADDTVGTLIDELALYGFDCVINNSGQLIIKSDGDSKLQAYTGLDKASNLLDLLGIGTGWVQTNSYESRNLQTSEVVKSHVDAQEDTLLKDLDITWGDDVLKAQGVLAVNVDGMIHKINITEDETFGSLKEKFSALGLEATIADGVFMVQSGYKDLSISMPDTTSSIVANLGLTFHDDLGGYSASNDEVQQTVSHTEDVVLSVSNYADNDTEMKLLNISSGILSVFRNGQRATINVDSEETFGQLRSRIATAFADVDIKFEDGHLKFYSNTGASVEVGSTTDTSNISAICGFVNDKSGTVKSSRELYRVNGDSKITTAGLFRRGDVTEGTFTVGDAVFTIDSNTTLQNIISQINASESANATASWDSVDGKLVIKSRTTGSSFINIEAGTSNFTDIMGYTKTELDANSGAVVAKRLDVNTQDVGNNAVFTINGTTYTSTSNTIASDVSRITGLTINLKGVSEGEEIKLKVERDKETVANAVSNIVDSYNELIENVDKEIAKGATLSDQSTLKFIRNQIRSLMTSSISGTGVFRNLDSIGISLDAATAGDISTANINVLSFDKDKFLKAFDADRDSLKDLLVGTNTTKGVFEQVETVVESALASNYGYFASAEKSYSNEVSKLDNKIKKAQEAVERYRERLEAKFASMDLLIANMQNQYSSFLG